MLIDLRYHIITVVIVFITLGIGILIGSTMVGNDLIIKEQQNLINSLEKNLVKLRNKNATFQTRIDKLETRLANNLEFQEKILPLVVQKKLKNQRLLVFIGDNMNTKLRQNVERILHLADINQLQIVNKKEELSEDFDQVLLLGEVDQAIKEKLSQKKKIIRANSKELQSSSDLIRLVFQLTSQDLSQLRSVEFE